MDAKQLKDCLRTTAFAFRGYNVTNLGRSGQLLARPEYEPIVADYLRRASRVCSEATGRSVDLIDRVKQGRETSLETYTEAVAMIVAMELAQLRLLEEFFGVPYKSAKVAFGYSLGELAAVSAGGVMEMEEALRPPLTLADECVQMADEVTMGVLFSRRGTINAMTVRRMCQQINLEGRGVIDVSSVLAPNAIILLGQTDTLDRFAERMRKEINSSAHLRKNKDRWPPLHTSIVWDKCISNRAARLMHTMKGGFTAPQPPVFSLITGSIAYDEFNARDLLYRWVDSPQKLWDAIYHVLSTGITTVVHVGPQPNIIPATFKRLTDNVVTEMKRSLGMRALSIAHPWLKSILPARTALLRAPEIEHVMLEDWLLEQQPPHH